MDHNDFEKAKAELSARSEISEAVYSEKSFGSWYITIATSPPRRLVWDGKESWLVVEEHTSCYFNSLPVWNELWIKRGADTVDLKDALGHMRQST